ncbi:hypothetical protein [Micromonospora sp. U21]|uniref:hypothetical protein n=1 Tax=Micromonospora sp. U21 TaxID=2824899 RepID=UPI001B371ABB|nr:hypothetical protein [Micromonospora sp. U21]MBQ0904985.1 hypothetical protein [Micromonospora sp. U21]
MVAPLVIPLAALIAAGVGAAGKGVTDLVQANMTAKAAQRDHELAVSAVEVCQGRTHEFAEDYGKDQLRAQAETIGRFAAWLEKNEHLVERLDRKVVAGVEVAVPSLPKLKFDVEQARTGLTGGFGALGAAASAQGAALWGVSAFASASTGTAISGLSGAAATNAALAWLGGGSLATGGGGMAAGAIVLNLIMIAPAAFITGITVGILGSSFETFSLPPNFAGSLAFASLSTNTNSPFDPMTSSPDLPTPCKWIGRSWPLGPLATRTPIILAT